MGKGWLQSFAETQTKASFVPKLCLLLFLLYVSNLHLIPTRDSLPARFLPFSLLLNGDLYLDEWIQPYLRWNLRSGLYFATEARGHWMSSYPILTPLLVTPFYVAPAWWLSQQPAAGRLTAAFLIADTMEKLLAAVIAALSVGVLYLALRRVVSRDASLAIAMIYGLASSTWSISSQALWTHTLGQLAFAFLLWSLLRDSHSRGYAFFVGLALAVTAANRPPNAVVAGAVLAYFALHQRARLAQLLVPVLVLGGLVLTYNVYFFGNPFGAYTQAHQAIGYSGILGSFRSSVWDGAAGLLVSPNRGLLVYMPWTIFAIWGAIRLWKERRFAWAPYIIAGVAGVFLFYAAYDRWWGGWCFGPRYLTDLLPFLAFFLTAVWERIQARHATLLAFTLTVLVAFCVQMVGAYYYPMGQWDKEPINVDVAPERIWDWSDSQIIRNWRTGPAPADLYYRWKMFLARRSGAAQEEATTLPKTSEDAACRISPPPSSTRGAL